MEVSVRKQHSLPPWGQPCAGLEQDSGEALGGPQADPSAWPAVTWGLGHRAPVSQSWLWTTENTGSALKQVALSPITFLPCERLSLLALNVT